MGVGVVEFILKARDEASGALARVAGGVTDLRGGFAQLASKAGVFGLVATGAAAAAGGIIAAGKAIADAVETLDRTAARTGVTIERLQAIQQVVAEGGGDIDSVTTALGFLNRAIATQDPLLAKLGITTRDTFSAFIQLAGILSRSSDAANRTEVAFKLMGRGAGDIIGLLGDIAAKSDEMQRSLKESGGLITGQTAEAARKLDHQLDLLGRTWKSLVVSFQTLAVPVASVLVSMFDTVLKAAIEFGRALRRDTLEPLEELAKVAAERKTQDERLAEAKREAARTGGNVQVGVPTIEGVTVSAKRTPDPLSGLGLGGGGKGGKIEREKHLEDIMRLLQVGRREAEKLADALDKAEAKKKAAELVKDLAAAGVTFGNADTRAGAATERRGVGVPKPTFDKAVDFDFEAWRRQVKELLAAAPKISGAWAEVGVAWLNTVQDMTSTTAVLDDTFRSVFDGLQQGFAQVFANLTSGSQTLRGALQTIFRSLVDEVLAELARLAAAKVFELLLSFIPGLGAIAGHVAGGAINAAGSGGGVVGPARPEQLPFAMRRSGGVTVNITAMNSRDVAAEIRSPNGQLREAFAQAGLAGAF